MRVAIPKNISEAYEKCRKYLTPGPVIDPDAPSEAKEAFEIWLAWKKNMMILCNV